MYEITGSAKATLGRLNDRQKAYLTTWLVNQHWLGVECPKVGSAQIEASKAAISLSVADRRDRLLREIADHTPALGQTTDYRDHHVMWVVGEPKRENSRWAEHDALLAATESIGIEEVEALIAFAVAQGLLSNKSGLALTFDGHAHLDRLRGASTDSLQGFVAMWFGADVAEAYDKGIAPAIADAGYKPMRIDQKEHNNKIDDEIIAEIRRSRFVVADFTCGLIGEGEAATAIPRGGVYYEAGFAQGLGIPVIWMCREDHINYVHFDTRQFNHITWTTPEELREKLRNRIGALLGDGPLRG
ncbi:MAG: hypothetical protein M9945_08950 [Aquamicrobium sp.]|uniref:hypothetical protein n=1 Tax=Aquamicrobium sp. TaxID=1872579 RepID=UPI00349EFC21|nr:hypothetical protein [Aquamicrobium sp.]